ncbi:MAG: hypothetical protein M1838_003090 [Thelocarpon superellum]|nr:MAG: hypothetical protein M1838_003090 [Thelocarpon superellum]
MAMSFDGLISHLLDEIALCGEQGASTEIIFDHVERYYHDANRASVVLAPPVDRSSSSAVDTPASTSAARRAALALLSGSVVTAPAAVDPPLRSKIWQWMIKHPDVILDPNGDGPSPAHDSTAARVRVSQDRIWHALTGHGVDWARCPRSEFHCLPFIASSREAGLLQTDLIKLTNQDKRSLPKRTDALHQKGYIEKKPAFAIARGQRTSLLTLRRFVSSVPAIPQADEPNVARPAAPVEQGSAAWTGTTVDGNALTHAVFTILKESELITRHDLKQKLEILKLPWQSRLVARLVRKMEFLGFVRRIRAASEYSKGDHYHACIKLMRLPKAEEMQVLWRVSQEDFRQEKPGPADDEGEDHVDDAPDILATASQIDPKATAAGSHATCLSSRQLRELGRSLPQWKPHVPLGNLIFDVVASAGTQGMSTMALKAQTFGGFYSRPLEVTLDRFTENFRVSQPPHLRHLALIKDVAQVARTPHYQYYTYDNFQKLVDAGRATWEGIGTASKQATKKAKVKPIRAAPVDDGRRDAYGFPLIPASRFVGSGGTATLRESVLAAAVEPAYISGRDFILVHHGGGSVGLGTSSSEHRPEGYAAVASYRRRQVPVDPNAPQKVRGRPRKYPKGQEPYTTANKAKARQALRAKALAQAAAGASPTPRGRPSNKRTASQAGLASEPAETSEVVETPVTTSATSQTLPPAADPSPPPPSPSLHPSSPSPADSTVTEQVRKGPAPSTPTKPSPAIQATARPRTARKEPESSQGPEPPASPLPSTGPLLPATSPPSTSKGPWRVQIDPPGSTPVPVKRRGRPRKRLIAVIQSEKLMTLDWFAASKALDAPASQVEAPPVSLHADSAIDLLEVSPAADLPASDVDAVAPAEATTGAATTTIPPKTPPTFILESSTGKRGRDGEDLPATHTLPFTRSRDLPIDKAEARATKRRRPEPSDSPIDATPDEATPAVVTPPALAEGSTNGVVGLKGGGSLTFLRRKIILDLVDRYGGVFAGDKELWYPYSMIWMKQSPAAGKPDVKTLKKIQKAMVDAGQLRSIVFTFHNSKGTRCQKTILTRSHIDPTSPPVQELQRRMLEADGEHYVPPELGVSAMMRRRLDQSSHGIYAVMPKAVVVENTRETVTLHNNPTDKMFNGPSLREPGTRKRKRKRIRGDWMSDGEGIEAGPNGPSAKSQQRVLLNDAEQRAAAATIKRTMDSNLWRSKRPTAPLPASVAREKGPRPVLPPARSAATIHPAYISPAPAPLTYQDERRTDARQVGWKPNSDNTGAPEADAPTVTSPWDHPSLMTLRSQIEDVLAQTSQPFHAPSGTFGTIGVLRQITAPSAPSIEAPARMRRGSEGLFQVGHVGVDHFGFVPSSLQDATVVETPRPISKPARVPRAHRTAKFQEAIMAPPSSEALQAQQEYEAKLPHSLEDVLAQKRKGRVVNHAIAKDPMWSKFEYEVYRVQSWEERDPVLWTGTLRDLRFINHTVLVVELAADHSYASLLWEPSDVASIRAPPQPTGWALATTAPPPSPPFRRVRVARPAPVIPKPLKPAKAARVAKRAMVFKTRSLTTVNLPAPDLVPPAGGSGFLGPVSTGLTSAMAKRRRVRRGRLVSTADIFSKDDDQRLLTAVAVVRTLIGGVGLLIDFVIVGKVLPAFDLPTIQRRWTDIRQRNMPHMEKLQAEFQELFIPAYEAGEVPRIDYESLADYDWNHLVDWAQRKLNTPRPQILPSFPTQRHVFDELFTVELPPVKAASWRDEYFGVGAPLFRRGEMLRARAWTATLPSARPATSHEAMAMRVAKSWIRANTMAREDGYDAETANALLLSLGEEALQAGFDELRADKLMTHVNRERAVPGRNFEMSDHFYHGLKKGLHEGQFRRAAAMKIDLDRAFQARGAADFSYHADDGHVLAITNLVAHRRIHLVPRNMPSNPFGLMDGDYKTRFMDKSKIHFGLALMPTASYVYGNPLLPLPPLPPHPPPADQQPIPAWRDIHGRVVPLIWAKAIAAVLNLLIVRPGMGMDELVRCLAPSLEEWELRLLMDWMRRAAVVAEVDEGWTLREWWWMDLHSLESLEGSR